MRRSTDSPRAPGTMLLEIAPLLFNEAFISAVVRPTIADLQSEFAAAGPRRVKRLRARWRGYRAFWTLILVAPFASWSDDASGAAGGRAAVVRVIVALFMIVTLGAWTAAVAALGALVAVLIHAWYERHPCELAAPSDAVWRSPQINFSSTEVAGNIGGVKLGAGGGEVWASWWPAEVLVLVCGSARARFSRAWPAGGATGGEGLAAQAR